MQALFWLIDTVLGLAIFFLIVNVIASWLIIFGIINSYQPLVQTILTMLRAITDPILRPIRRFIPAVNGVDLSPLIALLLLYFLRILIGQDIYNAVAQ